MSLVLFIYLIVPLIPVCPRSPFPRGDHSRLRQTANKHSRLTASRPQRAIPATKASANSRPRPLLGSQRTVINTRPSSITRALITRRPTAPIHPPRQRPQERQMDVRSQSARSLPQPQQHLARPTSRCSAPKPNEEYGHDHDRSSGQDDKGFESFFQSRFGSRPTSLFAPDTATATSP